MALTSPCQSFFFHTFLPPSHDSCTLALLSVHLRCFPTQNQFYFLLVFSLFDGSYCSIPLRSAFPCPWSYFLISFTQLITIQVSDLEFMQYHPCCSYLRIYLNFFARFLQERNTSCLYFPLCLADCFAIECQYLGVR